jgi:DUF4097 and DUF4098 domain-containing protein YvlB
MTQSAVTRLLAATLMTTAPVFAAVTTRGVTPDDTPRAAWFDRYAEARQGPEQTERFSQTHRVGRDGSLDLQNISGDVRITGGPGDEIRVEAVKRVRHRNDEDARRLLEELRIEVTNLGGRVEVRTSYPRSRNYRNVSASVDYAVTVPASASVAVKTISGDVSVGSVDGEVRAETVSGDVDVSATPQLALAKTVSGDVTARNIGAQSALTLESVSGSVTATALKVRTLDAGTVSGDVQLSAIQVDRLQAKSVSGSISFESSLARGGRYEFNSHSGNVRILLASNTGFELDATTFSGSIRSDFPITLRSTIDRDPDSRGRGRGGSNRTIRGSYGDASAVLAVRSFSGTVVITKK